MNQTRRISGPEVIAAYRKTGMAPAREQYLGGSLQRLCGCPFGAIYVASHPAHSRRLPALRNAIARWAENMYGEQYVIAFSAAFDHGVGNLEKTCIYAEQRSIDGFNDGRAVARAVWMEFAEAMA